MFELFARLEAELPPVFALIAGELRARAAMTLEGHAPSTLPMPEAIIPPAPPIPRTRVFLLKDAKWNEGGVPQFAERFDFRDLPIEVARKAIEIGVAALPESEQAQKWKHLRRGAPPLPEKCVDLDTGELPKPPAGIVPWDAFRHLDRGPPVAAFMQAPSFEPAAACSVPPNNNESDQ